MVNIQWDSKFEVGHDRIDFEHRIFLDLIRAIAEEITLGNRQHRVARLLREVHKYADFHFTSEENIMEDHAYPDLSVHKQQHLELISLLQKRMHDFQQGMEKGESVVDFLFHWFALHTTQEDRKLSAFLAGKT